MTNDSALGNPAPVTSQAWVALWAATTAQVAVSVVMQGVPTLVPFIQRDLGLSRGQVGAFASALNVGVWVALSFTGWAVDALGDRAVMTVGVALTGILSFAVAAAGGFWTGVIGLILTGLGGSTTTPAGSKAVMTHFPPHRRGFAMGFRQTGIPLGGALAAATLPWVAARYGWRTAVVAAGVAALAGAVVSGLLYRGTDKGQGLLERTPIQRVPFSVLLRRDVALACFGAMLLPPAQFVLIMYFPLYLKEQMGLPLTVGASMLMAAQFAGAAARILLGAVSDRWFGQRRVPVLVLTAVTSATASAILAILPGRMPLTVIAALALLYGFTSLGWHGLFITLISELAGPESQGRSVALAMTFLYTGIIFGPPAFGYLVDHSGSYRLAWLVLAGTLTVGAGLLLLVREGAHRPAAQR